jgi:SAM-dependent methyltransferase
MASSSSSSLPAARFAGQPDRWARVYEEEIHPLFGQKLADLLVRGLSLPERAHVLLIGCGLGTTTAELVHKTGPESRIIAVEESPALAERARASLPPEYRGRRIFFQDYDPEAGLPFSDGAFDCVLAATVLAERTAPTALIAEIVRVTKPGGEIRVASPLAGTWHEFLDVYGDVLLRLHKDEARAALAHYSSSFPEAETVALMLEAAGTARVDVERARWELVFRTGREFFYAPVIEFGPLARWKTIAGKGPEMKDTFLAVKEAIDTYFAGRAFGVSVVAGSFVAVKV